MDKETNAELFNKVAIINKETKKKPHNITIKNNNPNEPKTKVNMKYSEKQKYRRYKTKIEPQLHNKIMIDEEDDIVDTIKKAFGIEPEKKRNFTDVETSGTPYYQEPKPIAREDPLKYDVADADRLNFYDDDEVIARPAPTLKPADLEPKTSSEITTELALPPALAPGRLVEIQREEAAKMAARTAAKTEAAERKKREEEAAAKERLDVLSKLSEKEKAKAAKRAEAEEKAKREYPAKRRKEFEEEMKKFRGLTDEERKYYEDNFERNNSIMAAHLEGITFEDRVRNREKEKLHKEKYGF